MRTSLSQKIRKDSPSSIRARAGDPEKKTWMDALGRQGSIAVMGSVSHFLISFYFLADVVPVPMKVCLAKSRRTLFELRGQRGSGNVEQEKTREQ